jgi:hypothetical protein
MPKQRSRDIINGYRLMGVDDWFAYTQDEDGNWGQLNTGGDGEWNNIPEELRDSQGGVFLVAVLMLERGAIPKQVEKEYTLSLQQSFGDS